MAAQSGLGTEEESCLPTEVEELVCGSAFSPMSPSNGSVDDGVHVYDESCLLDAIVLPDAFRGNEALLEIARQCRVWLTLTNFVRTSLEIGSLDFFTLTMKLSQYVVEAAMTFVGFVYFAEDASRPYVVIAQVKQSAVARAFDIKLYLNIPCPSRLLETPRIFFLETKPGK